MAVCTAQFDSRCAGCHGADGGGGEHGPSILDGRSARTQSKEGIRAVIRNGVPDAGMPGFPNFSESTVDVIASYVLRLRAPAFQNPPKGDAAAGERFFSTKGRCFDCHMVKGHGGIMGPDLSSLGLERRLTQIENSLRHPGTAHFATLRLREGRTIRAVIKDDSGYDLLLQEDNGRLRSIPKSDVLELTEDPQPLMSAVKASPNEIRDLTAFLSRLAGIGVGPIASAPISPVQPQPGDWPTSTAN